MLSGCSHFLCNRAYNPQVPITGLGRGELSARVFLVLFCVCFGGLLWPHSGEGPPIAERVIFGVVRFVRLNQALRTKTR
jgi:hypothetical protein